MEKVVAARAVVSARQQMLRGKASGWHEGGEKECCRDPAKVHGAV